MRGSKADLPKTVDVDELTIWETDWGEMHVNITVCHRRLDITPLLKGLPDNKCQCPHWGMILKGRKVVRMRIAYEKAFVKEYVDRFIGS